MNFRIISLLVFLHSGYCFGFQTYSVLDGTMCDKENEILNITNAYIAEKQPKFNKLTGRTPIVYDGSNSVWEVFYAKPNLDDHEKETKKYPVFIIDRKTMLVIDVKYDWDYSREGMYYSSHKDTMCEKEQEVLSMVNEYIDHHYSPGYLRKSDIKIQFFDTKGVWIIGFIKPSSGKDVSLFGYNMGAHIVKKTMRWEFYMQQ